MFPAALFCCGEKSLKTKSAGCLPGDTQCCNDCTRAGNGANSDTRLGTLFYQFLTGIGDGRTAGIRYQRTSLAGKNPLYNLFTLLRLVVLKVADEAFFDAQMIQKLQGNP